MSRTFVMVKPDGVRRGLVGRIVARLEAKGLVLTALKLVSVSPEMAAQHYEEHRDKPFYPELVQFITAGPAVAMVWEGREAVAVVRGLMGVTDPAKAAPGTIRGDWALSITENLVHGSDGETSADREMRIYFSDAELSAGTQRRPRA
ncbi:MAG: nucleoside-diphosphate kinase [Thermaerobacter sp.]|nr:nucleoside-diphosphate kinase [Thermaerobacter sp.]